jgi:TRAP-type C4-dicarboxylate transport system permease small subunit
MKLSIKGRSPLDGAISFLAFLAGLIIVFVFVSVCFGVFMRYVVDRPIGWIVQISEYGLVFICYLAAAWVLRSGKHVEMEIVLDVLNTKARSLVRAMTSVLGAVICLVLLIFGVEVVWDLFERNIYDPQVLDIPMAPLVAVVPLGFLMLFFQFLRRARESVRDFKASRGKGKIAG